MDSVGFSEKNVLQMVKSIATSAKNVTGSGPTIKS
jgi:hypothetical protein